MRWAIFDTSVYIDHWEKGLYDEALTQVRQGFIVRHSAVVLSELRRGAVSRKAQRLVESLRRLAPAPWAPTADDWWRTGEIIRRIGGTRQWDRTRRDAFQNDTLIGLTARTHGATVVTTNHDDFELLSRELGVRVWLL